MHAHHRFAAAASLFFAACLTAGPINPPAGPIVSTNKTLQEVEPSLPINPANTPGDADSTFRITQPGAYHLTGNLTGAAGRAGIEIAADNVTIDLRGFVVQGVPGALAGITTAGIVRASIHIRDGSIQGWPAEGAILLGASHRFTRVNALNNTGRGLSTASGSFDSCTATGNGTAGFFTTDNCHFIACTARANTGEGFTANVNAIFDRCIASTNTSHGFNFGGGSALDCVSANNGAAGFLTTSGSTFQRCLTRGNSAGFSTGTGAVVIACEANNSTGLGIVVGQGSTVRQCVVDSCASDGIVAATRCSVSDCTSNNNTNSGIRVSDNCVVTNNHCAGNGVPVTGAGILATGGDNRIEGNNVSNNRRGIDVDAAGSIITRNTAAFNSTNFDIVAGNRYGPIVDITPATAPAALGNTAPSSMTSTDPFANFAY